MEELSRLIRDNKPISTLIIAAVISFIVAFGGMKTFTYISTHKQAEAMKNTLEAEDWFCLQRTSMGKFQFENVQKLSFDDKHIYYSLVMNPGATLGADGLGMKEEAIADFDYYTTDSHTISVYLNGKSQKITMQLKDGNKTLVTTPSFVDGSDSKEWYSESYFLEKNPKYKKYLNK